MFQRNIPRTAIAALCAFLLSLFTTIQAQESITGTALIVQQPNKSYGVAGKIMIVEMKDGKVATVKGPFGSKAISPRFSPDGKKFAYMDGGKCVVADLEGKTLKSWSARGMQLSWCKSAIWVHGGGFDSKSSSFVKYSPEGKKLGSWKSCISASYATVSYEETAVAGQESGGNKIGIISNGKCSARGIGLSKTCSMCPSPSGKLFTANLWDGGAKHRKMDIRSSAGKRVMTLGLYDVCPVPKKVGFAWNFQMWTGHYEDYILCPAGQGGSQWKSSAIPFLVNIQTKKGTALCEDVMMKKYWMPYDFYFTTEATGVSFDARQVSTTGTMNLLMSTDGRLTLLGRAGEELGFEILGLNGRLLKKAAVRSGGSVPLSHMSPGNYIVRIMSRGRRLERTILVP